MTDETYVEGITPLRRRLLAIGSERGHEQMMGTLGLAVVARAKEHTERFRKTGTLGRSIHVADQSPDFVRVAVDAVYAPWVEYGTRPHDIYPRRARALRFATSAAGRRLTGSPRRGADVVFARHVRHPGTRPQPFLRPAAEEVLRESGVLGRVVVDLWNDAA